MVSRSVFRIIVLAVILGIGFSAIPAPAHAGAADQSPTSEHHFKFYLQPDLVPDLKFARAVLPLYIADMNAILTKNTNRRLLFDPETDIILTDIKPHSDSSLSPLPVDRFEIWAHAVPTRYAISHGGYAGLDTSGAGVLAGLKWTRIYNPAQLASTELTDYWTQINNMLHELAHVFGAGIGEYYNLAVVRDTTGSSPRLDINLLDPADSFWSTKPDFMADPLLLNPIQRNNASLTSREALTNFVQFSALTATVMNGDFRNSSPMVDLSNIILRVVDAKGNLLENADVKVWSVAGNTYQSQLMVDGTTDANGEIAFAWDGAANPHNSYDFLRLIKVYRNGYLPSAKYVSIFDADIEKLVLNKDQLHIQVILEPEEIVPTFGDVPASEGVWKSIETLYVNGITGGCSVSPRLYCPNQPVTRAQMAVFLERSLNGSSYSPLAPSAASFDDVPTSYWAAAWIEKLVEDGITSGCGNGNYCPEAAVTRAQMAVFLLRAKYGPTYQPPAVGSRTGFEDVPASHWAAPWIKQLAAEGITAGCGAGNYCPEFPVSRAQMAVFLVRTLDLD